MTKEDLKTGDVFVNIDTGKVIQIINQMREYIKINQDLMSYWIKKEAFIAWIQEKEWKIK